MAEPSNDRRRAERLLRTWCDGLIALQITEHKRPELHGGILSPMEAWISGRCGDAVYPLLCCGSLMGEGRYIDAADRLLRWTWHPARSGGSIANQPLGHEWHGVTVFFAMSLAKALIHHGDVGGSEFKHRLEARLRPLAGWMLKNLEKLRQSSINYTFASAASLAACSVALDDDRLLTAARRQRDHALRHVLESGCIVGEGFGRHLNVATALDRTPRGATLVDIGYNVEESIPSLAMYAELAGDVEARGVAVRALRWHVEYFALPDGGLDAGWCSRSGKWTYWGSRTSDGIMSACCLLAGDDPRFFDFGLRNLWLLEACTDEAGLLRGGPHEHHVAPPSVHHTYPHAKALAAALDAWPEAVPASPPDPAVLSRTPKVIDDCGIALGDFGPWRLTTCFTDLLHLQPPRTTYPTGGCIALLHNAHVGPLLVATQNDYGHVESTNVPPNTGDTSSRFNLTPRIETTVGDTTFASSRDPAAIVTVVRKSSATRTDVHGHLTDAAGSPLESAGFTFAYHCEGGTFELTASVENHAADLLLPIISDPCDAIGIADTTVTLDKSGGVVLVEADVPPEPLPNTSPAGRVFHPMPGMQALLLRYPLVPGRPLRVRITVAL